MLAETHKFILNKALKISKGNFKEYKKDIEKGLVDEDYPHLSFNPNYFRIIGSDHFYNPINKRGYFRFSENAKSKGLEYFNKAVFLYKKGDFKEAFIFLGKSLHMLADTASPSHTKLEFHLIDIFEHYINNELPKIKFKIKSKIILRISPGHCFDRLASLSYKIKYKRRFFEGLLYFLGFALDKDKHKKLHKISNKLISETILYSALLLTIFYSKIKNKKIKDITFSRLNKIRLKVIGVKENIKKLSKKIIKD